MANSPQFSFRLKAEDKASVIELSKVYGAPSPGAFCAEMVSVMCSGDAKRISEFNTRLLTKMGEQLALDFVEKATKDAKKRALQAKRRPR
jgi:hypothetical protein